MRHVAAITIAIAGFAGHPAAGRGEPLPLTLAETGLYAAGSSSVLAAGVQPYEPAFPLWSDGEGKSRWIWLPPGSSIDASDPANFVFPVGTKLWKEFRGTGPIETRFMELGADGSWDFATYVWAPDGQNASLAPARGLRNHTRLESGVQHDVPASFECGLCHEGQPQRVLGFSVVQLSSHEAGRATLQALINQGQLRGVERATSSQLALAARPQRERAVLGALHANCGHCHNRDGALASIGLDLRFDLDRPQPSHLLTTTLDQPATATARSAPSPRRLVAGAPERSQLLERIATRDPLAQMPPLGTHAVDTTMLAELTAWIRDLPQAQSDVSPTAP